MRSTLPSRIPTAVSCVLVAFLATSCSNGSGKGDGDGDGKAPKDGRTAPLPGGTGTPSGTNAGQGNNGSTSTAKGGFAAAFSKAVAFSCQDAEDALVAKNVVRVKVGDSALYVGYRQVSSTNKNPVLARYDSGKKAWCREDLEVTGDDGTGYGLGWDGGQAAWAVFTSTGTQGTEAEDFRRFAKGTWQPSYGAGGGAKIAVLARVDAASGTPSKATFLRASKSDGKANSLAVTGLSLKDGRIVVEADSWFSPVKTDKTPYDCTGGTSPFRWVVELDTDLAKAHAASAGSPCQ